MALRRAAAPARSGGRDRARARGGGGRRAAPAEGPRSPVVLVTCAPARTRDGVGAVRRLPGEGLEEDEAEGVDVGSRVADLARRLLGGQVEALLGGQEPRSAQARPQPETLDLHLAVVGHHEPRGSEEPVRERLSRVALPRVQRLERHRGPARDHERVVRREREGLCPAALEDRGERPPLHELRGDVEGLLDPPDAQDAHEAGARHPCREPRLVHQAPRRLDARGDARAEAGHGDEAVEPGRAEARGTALEAERPRLPLLEEDEPSELLPDSHGMRTAGCRGR